VTTIHSFQQATEGAIIPTLNVIEVRVLACLLEKSLLTPDYYPLTLNSLTLACNQTSNRDPVMSLDETAVVRALDTLRDKRLATLFNGADNRVPKYKHGLPEMVHLDPAEVAVMLVLLLRGPQTVGEIRTRSERLLEFEDLPAVEAVLNQLAARPTQSLVAKLPRLPGTKEPRYSHLLAGSVTVEQVEKALRPEPATLIVRTENDRTALLEKQVEALREELEQLKSSFADFRKQFE
jgi:uncharacterized protein YceH (UPF0502 family)